jgi:hypothetical protein
MPEEGSTASNHEELQPLLERADASGLVEASELQEALELLDLDPTDVEQLHKELEERGIEVVDRRNKEPAPPLPGTETLETTTDALQLFLREIGRHPLLTAADEVELSKRIERGDMEAKKRSPASRRSRRSPTRRASRSSRRSRCGPRRAHRPVSTSRSASRRTRSSATSWPGASRSPTR